jgi:hypothetical protein
LHALTDGRVLVNDAIGRRLVLFDSTLKNTTIVAAATGAPTIYGDNGAVLIPAPADTTFILDPRSIGFLVLDPNGKVARVIAAPKPSDISVIVGYTGIAFLDTRARLIYRGILPAPRPVPGAPPPPAIDSAPLIRADFDTRRADTIGMIRVPQSKTRVEKRPPSAAFPNGGDVRILIYNPLLASDDWVVTSDGTIAIIRASDYHIDWIRLDGTTYSTPKMPFDWRRLTDADKQKIIDDARVAREKIFARLAQKPSYEMVAVDDMDNYLPAVRWNSSRADLDGNVWIPPTTSFDASPGSLVYDVVNTKGEVTKRVQIPQGRTLVGFGRGGVLFYTASDSTGTYLERARIK